jgi:hypothetical protein
MRVGTSINEIKITTKSYACLSYWRRPAGSPAPWKPASLADEYIVQAEQIESEQNTATIDGGTRA